MAAGSAGRRQLVESVDGVDGDRGPGGPVGQMQQGLAGAAGDAGRDGEQAVAESFGFPAAGVVAGEGEGLHPGGDVQGERDDGAPDVDAE